MKTYFLAWESDNKRGHAIYEFPTSHEEGEITPRQALSAMIDSVYDGFTEDQIPIKGIVSATQFNLVT